MSKQKPTTREKRSAQVLDNSVEYQATTGSPSAAPSRRINERRRIQVSFSADKESSTDSFSDDEKYVTPIKSRKRFSAGEKSTLEQAYQKANLASPKTKQELADKIKTTHKRIQTWFQNRRAKKQKKISGGGGEGPGSTHCREISSNMNDIEPTTGGIVSRTNPLDQKRRKRKSKSKKAMIESEKKRRVIKHHDCSDQLHPTTRDYCNNSNTNHGHRIIEAGSSALPTFYQGVRFVDNTLFNREAATLQYYHSFITRQYDFSGHYHTNIIEPCYYGYNSGKLYYNTVAPLPINNPQDVPSLFSTYVVPFDPYPYLSPPLVVSGQPQECMMGGAGTLMYNKGNINVGDDFISRQQQQQAASIVLNSQHHHSPSIASGIMDGSNSSYSILANKKDDMATVATEEK